VPASAKPFPIHPEALGLSHLAQFVGIFANRYVLSEMKRAGYGDLRESHGYIFQHLLKGPHAVGELAKLLGVSQQSVSKTVAELTRAGYLDSVPGDDARVRLVTLSARGHASVLASRRIREKLERRLSRKLGVAQSVRVRRALVQLLQELGGVARVSRRDLPAADTTVDDE
jgi:DNA-binding MarR family transcriptional regulator